MPRPLNRFAEPQPRLQRRRWHHVQPKQQQLLDRTAQRRRDRGVPYDAQIFRPTAVTINDQIW